MKLESGPEKSFTIERAEEIRQEIEEVIALIDSENVLSEDFINKLQGLKDGLSELVTYHIIRREIITKIDIIINLLKQYNNLLKSQQEKKLKNLKNQINSLLEELKIGLSHVLEVLEKVFLDNLKNFLLNLHLAESALENTKKFSKKKLTILDGVKQSISRILDNFPKYENIETKEPPEFSNFNEFLDYLIKRINEALKALEGIEGIEDKANIRTRLETVLTKLTLLKAGRAKKK
jgi:hypothetical protein